MLWPCVLMKWAIHLFALLLQILIIERVKDLRKGLIKILLSLPGDWFWLKIMHSIDVHFYHTHSESFSSITLKAFKKVSMLEVTNLLYFAYNFPWLTVAKWRCFVESYNLNVYKLCPTWFAVFCSAPAVCLSPHSQLDKEPYTPHTGPGATGF